MKKDLHPQDYRLVVFLDEAAGFSFLTKSTAPSTETVKWEDGQEYPLVRIYISSASHPFFTGEEKIIDTEGRVDRFAAKMKAAAEAKAKMAARNAKKNAKPEAKKLDAEVDAAVEKIDKAVGKAAATKEKVIDTVADEVAAVADKVEEKLGNE